jgi:hypothetical protein
MKGTDVIRSVLDLIDEIDNNKIEVDVEVNDPQHELGDSRFKQIVAMLGQERPFPGTGATTKPNPVVTDIDSVTTNAGGGLNGPKHPADIRVKDPRGYE